MTKTNDHMGLPRGPAILGFISLCLGSANASESLSRLSNDVTSFAVLPASLVCAAGLIWACGTLLRSNTRSKACIALVVVLAVLLSALSAGGVLVWRNARRTMECAESTSSLIGIHLGILKYEAEHGVYPPTLQDVFLTNIMAPEGFISPCDPGVSGPHFRDGELLYSSFIYAPGPESPVNEPDIMIAYDRDAFCTTGFGLRAVRVRNVLFADTSRPKALTEDEFREATRKDHQRRRELGWLTTQPARAR